MVLSGVDVNLGEDNGFVAEVLLEVRVPVRAGFFKLDEEAVCEPINQDGNAGVVGELHDVVLLELSVLDGGVHRAVDSEDRAISVVEDVLLLVLLELSGRHNLMEGEGLEDLLVFDDMGRVDATGPHHLAVVDLEPGTARTRVASSRRSSHSASNSLEGTSNVDVAFEGLHAKGLPGLLGLLDLLGLFLGRFFVVVLVLGRRLRGRIGNLAVVVAVAVVVVLGLVSHFFDDLVHPVVFGLDLSIGLLGLLIGTGGDRSG